MAAPTLPSKQSRQASDRYLRRMEYTSLTWIPHSPLYDNGASPSVLKPGGIICNGETMDSPTLSVRNERQITGAFKSPVTIQDGIRLDDFNLTIRGNGIVTAAAMQGQNIAKSGSYAFMQEGILPETGTLIIYGWSKEADGAKIRRATVFPRLEMKVTDLGGNEDDSTYAVTFFADEPEVFEMQTPIIPGWEVFLNGVGTITNAAMPYGAGATVTFGTGNSSYSGGVTDLTAADLRDEFGATDGRRFLIAAIKDGTLLDLSNMTYAAGTAGISPATVTLPSTVGVADGEYLILLYAVDTESGTFTDLEVPGLRDDLGIADQNVLGSWVQPLHRFVNG